MVLRGDRQSGGKVGVIVGSPVDPFHAYRVRWVDGQEQSLNRAELEPLKFIQSAGMRRPESADAAQSLERHVIYRCIVGSRAYGLEHESSDIDTRGIYVPPAEDHWSLFGVAEQIESDEAQSCYWEIQKFLTLALKANPNILECLYTPLVQHADERAQELLEMRAAFLSRLIYRTYNGYVLSQFKKLEQDLRARGALRWKHAMHLIRLLLAGIVALREGHVPVRVEQHREALLEIKHGARTWDEVNAWRLRLHGEFEDAHSATTLPERPDDPQVNALLVRIRRWRADHG